MLYESIGSENVEPPDIAKYLDETRNLMQQGKYKETIRYSYNMAMIEGYADLQWTDPYHTALRIEIKQKINNLIKDYFRSVNFETGEIQVKWRSGDVLHTRRSFVSRTDNIIVQLIENENRDVNSNISLHMLGDKKNEWSEHKDKPPGFEDPYQEINFLNSHYDFVWEESDNPEKEYMKKGIPKHISFKENQRKSFTHEISK
jgi:hypothetical protein